MIWNLVILALATAVATTILVGLVPWTVAPPRHSRSPECAQFPRHPDPAGRRHRGHCRRFALVGHPCLCLAGRRPPERHLCRLGHSTGRPGAGRDFLDRRPTFARRASTTFNAACDRRSRGDAAPRTGISGIVSRLAGCWTGRHRLDLVRQSVQFHGRYRRHHRHRSRQYRRGILVIGLVSAAGVEPLHLHALVVAAAAAAGSWSGTGPRPEYFSGISAASRWVTCWAGFCWVWPLPGNWAAALILPSIITDATLTLLRRLALGRKVWQAHREHFYQQAVQNGRGHGQVSAPSV